MAPATVINAPVKVATRVSTVSVLWAPASSSRVWSVEGRLVAPAAVEAVSVSRVSPETIADALRQMRPA